MSKPKVKVDRRRAAKARARREVRIPVAVVGIASVVVPEDVNASPEQIAKAAADLVRSGGLIVDPDAFVRRVGMQNDMAELLRITTGEEEPPAASPIAFVG